MKDGFHTCPLQGGSDPANNACSGVLPGGVVAIVICPVPSLHNLLVSVDVSHAYASFVRSCRIITPQLRLRRFLLPSIAALRQANRQPKGCFNSQPTS